MFSGEIDGGKKTNLTFVQNWRDFGGNFGRIFSETPTKEEETIGKRDGVSQELRVFGRVFGGDLRRNQQKTKF